MFKDLLLDSHIRTWVFLPIVLFTFLVEFLTHNALRCFKTSSKSSISDIKKIHLKNKLAALEINYQYIPEKAFENRRQFLKKQIELMNTQHCSFQSKKTQPVLPDQGEQYISLIREHSANHLPMILAGAWVSYIFSGFICTKIPIPLTFAFKQMLQKNIDLSNLQPSWVSSHSWYFLNVFGFRNVLNMFFYEQTNTELNNTCLLNFKGESITEYSNKLNIISYKFYLANSCDEIIV
ncbi:ER membrane protein complex subunit 3-like [Sitophilus oryzae]|uniref:ER membrane protein complex subunit 3 n=1 Tax=Sitophilus oryzae TaxID=7048 RepID=A0A6J2Y5D6_SITOR|nr:ER membrane protein complex subunit 3-like [Sitophilus oryzae]